MTASNDTVPNRANFKPPMRPVLKGSTRIADPILVSECDDFEDCDFTSMTSQSRDGIDDVTNRHALVTFLYRVLIVQFSSVQYTFV